MAKAKKKPAGKKKAAKKPKRKAAKKARRKAAKKARRPAKAAGVVLVQRPEIAYSRAEEIFDKHKDAILKIPGVVGVDLGYKETEDRCTRTMALRVHVAKKHTSVEQTKADPNTELIPPHYEGLPTDVLVRNFKWAAGTSNNALPLGGERISRKGDSDHFGTMGIDVVCRDGLVRMLTAAHVIDKNITPGIKMQDGNGTPIGTAMHRPGVDWEFDSEIDCALIDPPTPQLSRRGMRSDIPAPTGIRWAHLQDITAERIAFMGGAKTPALSMGKIRSIHSRIPAQGIMLEDHIQIVADSPGKLFADEGDSGAVVIIGEDVVGIIRAVDRKNKVAIACPMMKVTAKLYISLG